MVQTPPPSPSPSTSISISTRMAVLLLVLYGLAYFLPFYASTSTRPSATLHRDAPSVIRARVHRVTVSCFACSSITYIILRRLGYTLQETMHLMGYSPGALLESMASGKAIRLTMLLFLGPLFVYLVVDNGMRAWRRCQPLKDMFQDWTMWRNIMVGPLTEEMLFRSASVPLLLAAGVAPKHIVLFAPLVFGLCHVHHFYDFRLGHPDEPVLHLVLRSVFQAAFTTVFGIYATFLYLRTGSVLGPFLVHSFCNAMSLPQVWGRVRPVPTDRDQRQRDDLAWQQLHQQQPGSLRSPNVPVNNNNERRHAAARAQAFHDPTIIWTVIYYPLLVCGAILFYQNLWPMTESRYALVPTRAFGST